MALADVVHNDIAHAMIRQRGSDRLGHLLRIAIHATVDNRHARLRLVTT